ncbi:MAG: hypothetical protein PHD01_03605 [Geobacteraceae bacterium]|nr:hypothetical protein [Geobacteraceae bacterium]
MEHGHQTQKFTLKYFGLLCIIMICTAFPSPAKSQTVENWQCTLDLHQGDTGTLEFTRTGALIKGKTIVHRGANTFENTVKGTWSGATIKFWRELNPSSSGQPFKGIAVSTDDNKVKMGGRFANLFAGVWSADCEAKAGPRRALPLPVPLR